MRYIYTFLIMFGFWIMLSGKLDLFHLILGSLSCLFVAVLFSDLLFQVDVGADLDIDGEAIGFFDWARA